MLDYTCDILDPIDLNDNLSDEDILQEILDNLEMYNEYSISLNDN